MNVQRLSVPQKVKVREMPEIPNMHEVPSVLRLWLVKTCLLAGVVALLLAVLSLYTRADFLVMLAEQTWSCF